jgi:hypothetical protein
VSGWIVAVVAVMTLGGGAVAIAGRWAWRTLRRTQDFLDDWNGHPARAGVPERPGVMARLSGIEQIGGSLQDQMRLNGGSSLRDVVQQTAGDVRGLKQDVAALKDQIAQK